jgi:FkbM family methyltransferase
MGGDREHQLRMNDRDPGGASVAGVADLSESVVAENRYLRGEVKALQARVAAFESSRWWRAHPRRALGRLRPPAPPEQQRTTSETGPKVLRLARQWRLRSQHERRNAGSAPDEIVVRDGIRLKIHPESRTAFELFCYWSPEMVNELDSFIAVNLNCRRLLDVGAFNGVFSLVFAAQDRGRSALAVDPSPIAFAKLLYNIHKNELKSVIASECALSNEEGTLPMRYSREEVVAGGGELVAQKRTGDSLCEEWSFAPDVIKIDVEGHEVNVIQGLRETIARNRPLIFLELHPPMISAGEANARQAELVSVLAPLGYRDVEIRGRTEPIESVAETDDYVRLVLRPDSA